MRKIIRILESITVNQFYNGEIVLARYEITRRYKTNYNINLYINGDYAYQWHSKNVGLTTIDRETAIKLMVFKSSKIILTTFQSYY